MNIFIEMSVRKGSIFIDLYLDIPIVICAQANGG